MNIFKKRWLISLVVVLVVLSAGSFYIGSLLSKEEQLSSDEISQRLEQMYEGTVSGIKLKKDHYIVEMTRADMIYTMEVDPVDGKVLSMKQLGEVEVPDTELAGEQSEEVSKGEEEKILAEEEIKKIIAEQYEHEIESIKLNNEVSEPYYEVEAVKNQQLVKVSVDAVSGDVISAEPQETMSEQAIISRDEAIDIAFTQLKGEVDFVEFEATADGGYYLIEIEQDNDDGDDYEALIQVHAITGKILSVDWDD